MEVLNEFRQAIQIESKKNAEDYALVMALSQNEKIAKGVTMANFTLKFDFRELPYSQWNETIEFPELKVLNLLTAAFNLVFKVE